MSSVSVRCLLSSDVSESEARVGRHTLEHGANASMVVVAKQDVREWRVGSGWRNSRRVRIVSPKTQQVLVERERTKAR